MKRLFILMLTSTALLQARIGETFEQCQKRYDDISLSRKPSDWFWKDGVRTRCVFIRGKCVCIIFEVANSSFVTIQPYDKAPRFTTDQCQRLLVMNSNGSKWMKTGDWNNSNFPGDGFYKTEDGTLHARVSSIGVVIERLDIVKETLESTRPDRLDAAIKSFGE